MSQALQHSAHTAGAVNHQDRLTRTARRPRRRLVDRILRAIDIGLTVSVGVLLPAFTWWAIRPQFPDLARGIYAIVLLGWLVRGLMSSLWRRTS